MYLRGNAYDCDSNCLSDADGDGICDAFEVLGCTDSQKPAYNSDATDDDGSCSLLVADITACNYDASADYLDIDLCDFNSCENLDVQMNLHATMTKMQRSTTAHARSVDAKPALQALKDTTSL